MTIMIITFIAASIASLVAGFFGGGSGLVLVPILNYLLTRQAIPDTYNMQVAIGTSLAVGITTMLLATYSQHKRNAVIWHIFRLSLAPTIVGVIVGSIVASQLSSNHLRYIFGVFILVLAIRNYLFNNKASSSLSIHSWTFKVGMFLIAISVGIIGAGILTIPFLRRYGLPLINAIAMTLALGIVTALFGTLSYIIIGLKHTDLLPSSCFGYVDWQLLLPLILGSILFSNLGVKFAHQVSPKVLHLLFCMFLLVIGLKMLF